MLAHLLTLTVLAVPVDAPPASNAPMLEVEGLAGTPIEVPSDQRSPHVLAERWWERSERGITERMAEVRLKRPLTPKAWLARWRTLHGCTADVTTSVPPIKGLRAPQLTFRGVCKGGDRYVAHVVQLKNVIVELHVDTTHLSMPSAQLAQAMRQLLSRVHRPTLTPRERGQ